MIYLASQSPRRRQLLDQIGVAHQLLLPGEDEDAEALEAERPGEPPEAYVRRVTLAKLQAALQRLERRALPAAPVLAADTTVALEARILGKPRDASDARDMLAALSGRAHRVLTAVALGGVPGRDAALALSVSTVRFAPLPAQAIERYVDGGEPFGKAGGYAIQGAIAAWVERVEGSHSGIVGLPLFETAGLLRQAGLLPP
ncbi:Maf family protein [Aquabacterium sp. J223]|uniref:Maf family protein n=1 Tax=Aquabacterium sp. J223 TaxID=2898431 RepID=UPI0021AD940E|nr:Maf family protein [Aquabacterium sp. J223]UUX94692.1 Maf family nucleotide pyrophosphatase [Aquabacterium sp. J223]